MENKKPFFEGFFSIFNICHPKMPEIMSDEEAIRSDWEKVGQDFKNVIQWEEEDGQRNRNSQ